MAGRLLAVGARTTKGRTIPLGAAGAHHEAPVDIRKVIIGNREVVGFGFNGQANYVDRVDFPMPAVRWQEDTPAIKALKEKEKGDWKQLSIEEKKALYRASFKQTYAEFQAPTGEWKSVFGLGLLGIVIGMWMFYLQKQFVYDPLPESFDEERKKAQLRRMLDIRMNPVEGISSQWDYDKDEWKR